MSYKELFSAIECNRIVIIEDDFKQGEYKKERALYDRNLPWSNHF